MGVVRTSILISPFSVSNPAQTSAKDTSAVSSPTGVSHGTIIGVLIGSVVAGVGLVVLGVVAFLRWQKTRLASTTVSRVEKSQSTVYGIS